MRNPILISVAIIFTFVAGCKEDKIPPTTTQLKQVEEDFFQKTSSPQVIVRDLAIGANGVMYAETPNGILQSLDSGASWTKMLSRSTSGSIVADTAGNVYTIDFSGILSSTDNGQTWTYRDSGLAYTFSDSQSAMFCPTALAIDIDGTVYVGGTSAGGIGKSTDHGRTWKRTSMLRYSINSLHISSKGTIIAAANIYKEDIYRSTDKGETWTASESISNKYVCDLASDTLGNLYACGSNFVWRSTDDGITWSPIAAVDSWMSSIAVNRKNHIYTVVVGPGTFRSTDFGETWQQLKSGIPEHEDRCLLFDNRQYLFVGTDNYGIYRSVKRTTE